MIKTDFIKADTDGFGFFSIILSIVNCQLSIVNWQFIYRSLDAADRLFLTQGFRYVEDMRTFAFTDKGQTSRIHYISQW